MASVSGHLLTDESYVEGEGGGGGGDDSMRVSSASAAAGAADNRDLVTFWFKRLQWLEAEVNQHEVHLVVLKNLKATSEEATSDAAKTKDLQQKLMHLATHRKIRQSIFHAVESGRRLNEIMSQESGKAADPRVENEILESLERTTGSVSNVLRIHKEIQDQMSSLLNLKEECVVLQQESRKLMHDLQRRLEEEEKTQRNGGSDDGDVRRLKNENSALKAKIACTQHCFLSLIFGSGVNWAKDQTLQNFVLNADRPFETSGTNRETAPQEAD